MSQPPQQSGPAPSDPNRQRLQRVLAAAGVASRRKAEEMIVAGRVTVDGRVVTELGTTVDPSRQHVAVDGVPVRVERQRYIVLNKPKGYITTVSDERGRQTVMELVDVPERVKPVGRLDHPSEGLLLFTNDGELAFRVMHPRYEIEKEYEVDLDGHPPPDALERVRRGIVLDGERVSPSVVRPLRNEQDGTVVKIIIHEGRNRVVRRMFETIGYPVLRLRRTRIGPLQIGSIPRGGWRDLTSGELEQIRQAVHLDDASQAPVRPPPRPADQRRGTERGRGGPPGRARDGSAHGSRERGGPERRREGERSGRPSGPERSEYQRRDRQPGPRPPRATDDRRSAPPRPRRETPPGERGPRPPAQRTADPTSDRRSGPPRPRRDGPPGERRDRPPGERGSRPPTQRTGGPGSDRRSGPPRERRDGAPDARRSGPPSQRGGQSGPGRGSGPPRDRTGNDRPRRPSTGGPPADRQRPPAPRQAPNATETPREPRPPRKRSDTPDE